MNNCTCIIKNGERVVFSSESSGIIPLLKIIDGGIDVRGCVAYDRIVGKAAALLYAYMGVKEVHADVMSYGAEEVFAEYRISHSAPVRADKILNRAGDGVCPMEKAVENITSPEEAVSLVCEQAMAMA